MVEFTPYTLNEAKQSASLSRPLRVYADGVFDLFHYGHFQFLRQIRDAFPDAVILAGVIAGTKVMEVKGAHPVMSDDERAESLRASGFVDEVIMDAPYYPNLLFLDTFKIDILAHDDLPYPAPGGDAFEEFKNADRFLSTKRTEGISTSDIIERIVSNAEMYGMRRGVPINGAASL